MSDIEEKRVFSERSGKTAVYVASGVGVVRVTVSGAQVGRFGVVHRGAVADVACDARRVAVAADDDVYVSADADGDADADDEFRSVGFGPATAVGFADGVLLAGDGDGRIARREVVAGDGKADADATDADGWTAVGETGAVRAIDGDMVATADGVYRVTDGGLSHAGLADAYDVTTAGTPLAATRDGLYRLGNGWLDQLDGAFHAVTADGNRAHAAGDDGLFERRSREGEDGDSDANDRAGDEWAAVDLPTDESVVDVSHAPGTTVVVTESGTLLTERETDWRTQLLGVRDVTGVAASR